MTAGGIYIPDGDLEELRVRGDIPALAALAKEMHAASLLDARAAEWLLNTVREWHTQGYLNEQLATCEMLSSLLPGHFEVLHLLGYAAQTRGDYLLAEGCFSRALAAKPDYAFSKLALAQLRMMRTRFAEGRGEYEARFDAVTEASGPDWRGLPIKRWSGEALEAKKLYLWAEQGLGDIVMFAGFLPFVIAQSPARIALGMFPKLINLFARSFPSVDVEPIDDAIHHALALSAGRIFPHMETLSKMASVPLPLGPLKAAHAYVLRHGLFDVAAPMGDLLVYGMPGFPPARKAPYLVADAKHVEAMRRRLNAMGEGRRIGISWHTANRREPTRNIPLELWLPLLRMSGCHFISLQHQVEAKEIEAFCGRHGCNITVEQSVDLTSDADGLAALIAAMDEVITIDNSNVHLAGALGIPTTLLLPRGCNYRWPELADDNTLWYRSVTTLRQCPASAWQPVMMEMAKRLSARV